MDINEIDKNALYLYQNGWGGYKIGSIKKVNTKSVTMDNGNIVIKFNEIDSKLYKLTDEELFNYRQELVKAIGNSDAYNKIRYIKNTLYNTIDVLKKEDYVCLDTEKLQEQINMLSKMLDDLIPKCFEVMGKEFKLNYYDYNKIEEIKECVTDD